MPVQEFSGEKKPGFSKKPGFWDPITSEPVLSVKNKSRRHRPVDTRFCFTYTLCVNFLTTLARPTMPRKPKTTEPEAKLVEAAPEAPRGAKTAAIKAALKANPTKTMKEIAELLKEQGFETTANYIGGVKSAMKAKKRKKAAPAAAPEAGPALPKDAVSVGLLVKAKKLVKELGGVKEAKTALNALAQLMD